MKSFSRSILRFVVYQAITLLIFLISLILFFVITFAFWPSFLINGKTVGRAVHSFAPRTLDITWDRLDIRIDTLDFFTRKLNLDSSQLCVKDLKSSFNGCAEKINLSVTVRFSHFIPNAIDGELNMQSHVTLANHSKLKSSLDLKMNGPYSIVANYKIKNKSFPALDITVLTQGKTNLGGLEGKLTAKFKGITPVLPIVEVKQCDLKLTRKPTLLPGPAELALNCPTELELVLEKYSPEADIPKLLEISTLLKAMVNLTLQTSEFPPGPKTILKGKAKVLMAPKRSPQIQIQAIGDVIGDGKLEDFPMAWNLHAKINSTVLIPEIQVIRKLLIHSQYAIPAPLNVLQGKLHVIGDAEANLNRGDIKLDLATHLESKTQKLNLKGDGALNFIRVNGELRPDMRLDVTLNDFKITLPRLHLVNRFPQFTPDPRFRKLAPSSPKELDKGADLDTHRKKVAIAAEKAEQRSLKYRIRVQTLNGYPALINCNLANSPIPIQVHLELNNHNPKLNPIQGSIQVARFGAQVLRRTAEIDHFTITLQTPMSESILDGLIRVDLTDYQLMVRVTSVLGSPRVTFTSDPPLPENQLVSALLFGLPTEDLTTDQSRTVGSARAALADGAVNLLSLYLLASTPIQSVSYDSASGMVTAKLRLGEGTTLNLGADRGDSRSIGVRKRLGSSWSVETGVSHNADQGQVGTAYLEWSHRY